MTFCRNTKVAALILALLTCLTVFIPAASMAECAQHDFLQTSFTPATENEDGCMEYVCSVCGAKPKVRIARIASVTLRTSSAAFKDKAQFPEITVTDADGNIISAEYYTVSMETEYGVSVPFAKAIGRYNIIITFSGNYSGTVTKKFKIVSPAVENVTLSSSGGSVTISYDAVDGAKGYQIYYSTHKHGSYKRLITTSQTTYTTSALKTGVKYYIRVRAYKTIPSGNIFGKLSAIRSVTVQ